MEYGLIGEKLGHSYSKLIQEKLLDHYEYELHPIEKDQLDHFMKAKAFKAINVTIPYKQTVIPYLDEMDDASKKIGAVNTIVNDHGRLIGHNTDYYGFRYMLMHHHINVKDKKVLVMGNGGASKAIQSVIKDQQAKCLLVVDIIMCEDVISIEEVYAHHKDVDIIVNTTPLGMYPKIKGCCIDVTKFDQLTACIDVVYNPYQTEFVLQAKKLGIQSVTGLEMLVAQAKYALEFFKNISINDNEIDRIYKEILKATTNVVITSSENAAHLATLLQKEFIDTTTMKGSSLENISRIADKANAVILIQQDALEEATIHDLNRNGFIFAGLEDEKEIIKAYQDKIKQL